MESWGIFKHAVWMVFANFTDALRVTGVLYVAMFAAQVVLVGDIVYDQEAMQRAMMDGSFNWGNFMLYMVIATLASIWAAIGWHRFVLLEERPAFLPRLLPGHMLAYFGKTLQVTLSILAVALVTGFAAGAVGVGVMSFVGADGQSMATMNAVMYFAIVLVFLPCMVVGNRLAPLLPAAALGLQMTWGEAWEKLAGKNRMLLALAVYVIVATEIFTWLGEWLGLTSAVKQGIGFVTGWLQLAVGASLVTTIYGVYCEGRSVN